VSAESAASFAITCLGGLVADMIAVGVDGLPAANTLARVDDVVMEAGGSALNTASVLALWRQDVLVAGKVGADELGRFLLETLDRRGLSRRAVVEDGRARTAASVVLVDGAADRRFLHAPGVLSTLALDELDPDVLLGGDALHIADALIMPLLDGVPLATLLARARDRRVLTSLDTAWDPGGEWQRLLPCLPHVDVFAPGLEEARQIIGQTEPARVARAVLELGVRRVALKMGSEGCWIAGEGDEGHIEGFSVCAVDGTGAGDAFSAGLVYGTLAGMSLREAATFANAAGALAVTAVGGYAGARVLSDTLAFSRAC
jgi:sugar/nucleoside kinase (ribokinase family)